MDVQKDIKWSSNLEHYFKELGEKSYCYAYLHKKAEGVFSYYRNFIDLPVIVLSTIAGTLSIGGKSFWGQENEQQGNLAIGIISLGVGVMNTIGAYFGFSKRAEAHRISHIQYNKLYRFLQIELSLPVEERMRANDLLKVSRDSYERLQEVAPLIPYKILEDFKKRFNENDKYADISKPSECNGLERVEIYGEIIKHNSIKKVVKEVEKEVEKENEVIEEV